MDYTRDAQYFEYSSSANPLGARLLPPVPYQTFPGSLYDTGPTRLVPLDASEQLDSAGPATAPGLLANFIRVLASESIELPARGTSHLFYVVEGEGDVKQGERLISYKTSDFLTFPCGPAITIRATSTTRLYAVDDSPLLRYLGASAQVPRFAPTHYPGERAKAELAAIAGAKNAAVRNRVSVLLGHANFPQTRTITHTLWAMFGVVPSGAVQKAHRHQSVALDFVADCAPGTYTLVGKQIDAEGAIINPTRVDWQAGMAFITPPGYWHAHYNESNVAAHIIPIQDAGLQTYLRALDIRFA